MQSISDSTYNVDPTQLLSQHDDERRHRRSANAAYGDQFADAEEERLLALDVLAGPLAIFLLEVQLLDLDLLVHEIYVAGCLQVAVAQLAGGLVGVSEALVLDVPPGRLGAEVDEGEKGDRGDDGGAGLEAPREARVDVVEDEVGRIATGACSVFEVGHLKASELTERCRKRQKAIDVSLRRGKIPDLSHLPSHDHTIGVSVRLSEEDSGSHLPRIDVGLFSAANTGTVLALLPIPSLQVSKPPASAVQTLPQLTDAQQEARDEQLVPRLAHGAANDRQQAEHRGERDDAAPAEHQAVAQRVRQDRSDERRCEER